MGAAAGGAALAPQPPSATLQPAGAGHRGPRKGQVPGPSDLRPPPCSSSEESEKNLRNLAEEEAQACAVLIK